MAEYGSQPAAELERSCAEERYVALASKRQPYLDEARACSELTIPSLIQPEDSDGAELATCAQDDGAKAVNGLATSIVLGNIPPNQPVMRFETAEIAEAVMDSQAPDPETKAAMDKSARETRKNLDRIARETLKITAAKGHRAVFYQGKRHLVCGGNILYWALDDDLNYGTIRAIPLSRFECLRDSLGFPIEIIIRDGLSAANLPPNLKQMLGATMTVQEALQQQAEVKTDSAEKGNLALYTYLLWKPEANKYEFHQAFKGYVVKGSKALYNADDCPLLALPFNLGDSESYGRGYVEESRGVLMALEALAQGETATSIALSDMRLMVGSGSTLRARELMNTPLGQPIDAEKDSITALSYGKAGDLASIRESMAMKQRQLGMKFGDYLSVQRDAERVTAKEWEKLTLALDRTLGGMSAGISARFLPWYARVLLRTLRHEGVINADEYKALTDGDGISPRLITGLDALGRNFEAQQFLESQQVLSTLMGPEAYARKVHADALSDKVMGYYGIESKGLFKSEEEIAQENAQEQQRQENLAVAPGIVDAYGKAATQQQGKQ